MKKNNIDLQILDEIFGISIAVILIPVILPGNENIKASLILLSSLGEFVAGGLLSLLGFSMLGLFVVMALYLREVISFLMGFSADGRDRDLADYVATNTNYYWWKLIGYYPIIIPGSF